MTEDYFRAVTDSPMAVQILNYRFVAEEDPETLSELENRPSSRHFELYIQDGRPRAEGKFDDKKILLLKFLLLPVNHYWINAQLAGNLWPLAVADFYIDHLVIEEPLEEEEDSLDTTLEADDDDPHGDISSDEEDIDEYIMDCLNYGKNLLQSGFKVLSFSLRLSNRWILS